MTLARKNRRGFTLLELTIILLMTGIVAAAIWVAVDHVWTNYRLYRVNQQILKTAQNIRDYYETTIQTWATPGFAANQNITAALDGLLPNVDIFPPEMRRSPTAAGGASAIDHAMNGNFAGGSFAVLAVTNAATGGVRLDAFEFQLRGLNRQQCIGLLMSAPLTSDTLGFTRVSTDAGGNCVIVKGICGAPNVTPMLLATAQNWCNGATQVNFDFALHN